MTTYRTGGHWGRTIVRVGQQPLNGLEFRSVRRPDDELVGLMDDPALAERICELLNGNVTDGTGNLPKVRDVSPPEPDCCPHCVRGA